MKNNYEQVKEIHTLLLELLAILETQKDRNWSQGIDAAAQELVDPKGAIAMAGFENARSIYKTMNAGGRGFAEYFVWSENEGERIQANKRLDDLRAKIWSLFNP